MVIGLVMTDMTRSAPSSSANANNNATNALDSKLTPKRHKLLSTPRITPVQCADEYVDLILRSTRAEHGGGFGDRGGRSRCLGEGSHYNQVCALRSERGTMALWMLTQRLLCLGSSTIPALRSVESTVGYAVNEVSSGLVKCCAEG